jgi:hypothetical protein
MAELGATMVARTLEELLENPAGAAADEDHRRVVLPSREDRQEFIDRLTVDLRLLPPGEPGTAGISAAHAWVLDAAHTWLAAGDSMDRAQRLARVLQHRLRVIVVEARAVDNPLRIARQLATGHTPISSVDIIGQTLLDSLQLPPDAKDRAYRAFLSPFTGPWWSEPADDRPGSESRLERLSRAWLMSRTLRVVTEAELAPAFQRYLQASTVQPLDLLSRLRDEGRMIREFAESGRSSEAVIDLRARFVDRMRVLGSPEAIAVLLWLQGPERHGISDEDKHDIIAALDSWVVRRVLTGLPISGPGAGWRTVLTRLGEGPATGLARRLFDVRGEDEEHYWPTDADLRLVLPARPIALELPESAARVLLEDLVEDAHGPTAVRRGEHRVVLLQPAPVGDAALAPMLRHVLGNLTLEGVPVVDPGDDIAARTAALVERAIRLWPGPPPPTLPGAAGSAPDWRGTAGR